MTTPRANTPRAALLWLLVAALALIGPAGCASGPDDAVTRRHKNQRKMAPIAEAVLGREAPPQNERLVFTSFRDDGELGFYLATSRDGFVWRNVSDRPVWVPQIGSSRGMRDPNVAVGPDGVYHMVWTLIGPYPRSIGYARSTDLVNWTDVRAIQVVPNDWPVKWTWAPELFYDAPRGEWLISWSVAIEGGFAETAAQAEHNHRLYYNTTRDFRTVSPAAMYYDPGFPVIDPAWLDVSGFDAQGGLVMFLKDERQWGPEGEKKQLRFARAPDIRGPWSEPSTAITMRWCEAPSPIILNGDIIVYFDEYTRGKYGAVRTEDLKRWDDISHLMKFPEGHRHGSVLRVPENIFQRLEAMRASANVQ